MGIFNVVVLRNTVEILIKHFDGYKLIERRDRHTSRGRQSKTEH